MEQSASNTFMVDLSHWEEITSYADLFSAVPACVFKATEGTVFTDPQFYTSRSESIKAGHPWAAYHFFRNGLDPATQARHFADVVGANCSRYFCDVETTVMMEMVRTGVLSNDALAALRADPTLWAGIHSVSGRYIKSLTLGIGDNIKKFLDVLEVAVNKRPGIYTSPGFWNYNVVPTPAWTSNYDLWDAHYTTAPSPQIPNGWTKYRMWQYTDKAVVPGVYGHVDGNWYNGTTEECVEYFGGSIPPPPPDPCFPQAIVISAGLKVRSGPGVNYTYWFTEPQGAVVDVLAKIVYDPNNIWLQVGRKQFMAMKYLGYTHMEWYV